jgi:uncharacterized protein DUF6886
VLAPSPRLPGREWLNGPLVWAIDAWHAPMYLFPRDCPRILMWAVERTTSHDQAQWLGDRDLRMVAYVERAWAERVRREPIHRYDMPPATFRSLDDAGMFVSREPVRPLAVETVSDLPAALRAEGVALRVVESLTPLREVWSSSLHVSGIRLRNAQGW